MMEADAFPIKYNIIILWLARNRCIPLLFGVLSTPSNEEGFSGQQPWKLCSIIELDGFGIYTEMSQASWVGWCWS